MTDEHLTRSEIINVFGEEFGRKLIEGGYGSISALAKADPDDLLELGLTDEELGLIWDELRPTPEESGDEAEADSAEIGETEGDAVEFASPHLDPPPPPQTVDSEGSASPSYPVAYEGEPPASVRIRRIRESQRGEH